MSSRVTTYATEVLYRPGSDALRFLPEGPRWYGGKQLSWVAIQHGGDATQGSLNLLDLVTRENQSHLLPGRPGFALPTTDPSVFLVGAEKDLGLFNVATGEWSDLGVRVEEDRPDTIINDGMAFEYGLIYGTKDPNDDRPIAGLYFWRFQDRKLFSLQGGQICSNGKAVYTAGGQTYLLDIDSPRKTVVRYEFDVAAGTVRDMSVLIDLTAGTGFPDGLALSGDGKSIVVAFYDPTDVPHGEARQYAVETGELEAIWEVPAAPQVTCPEIVELDGRRQLILTSAVEHMSAERQASHPNSGCLFMGDADLPPQKHTLVDLERIRG